MTDELRNEVMAECLKVSRLACSIFDATEADAISPATAQAIVDLNESVHAIHAGLVALVVSRR